MLKEKFPYQLSAGDKISLGSLIKVVEGVTWIHGALQYRIYLTDGTFIMVAKIKTVSVIQ